MASLTHRQIIRSLSSFSSTQLASTSTSSAAASKPPPSSLSPPYAHSAPPLPGSSPSLAPPYAHEIKPEASPKSSFIPSPRFFIPPTTPTPSAKTVPTRVKRLLETSQGREKLRKAWTGSILGIDQSKSSGAQIPQVSFVELNGHLSDKSTVQAIRERGVLVVRDVVYDEEVRKWTGDTVQALRDREGRLTFWDKSLLAARSHSSVLSANNQVLAALTGHEGEAYIQASAVRNGIEVESSSSDDFDQPWAVNELGQADQPSTPLSAHLALTRPGPSSNLLTPSIHTAAYTSLHPFFRPRRSRISFYHSSAYLDPENWELVDSADDIGVPVEPTASASLSALLPHLSESGIPLPQLEPGDLIYRHISLPVFPSSATAEVDTQIFLPVSPLPRHANEAYVALQREAFESGMPPQGLRGVDPVLLEMEGSRRDIKSGGGRRAMGYD